MGVQDLRLKKEKEEKIRIYHKGSGKAFSDFNGFSYFQSNFGTSSFYSIPVFPPRTSKSN